MTATLQKTICTGTGVYFEGMQRDCSRGFTVFDTVRIFEGYWGPIFGLFNAVTDG